MLARALVEAQVEADQLIAATGAALASDGDLLRDDERRFIDAVLADVATARAGDDHHAIRAAIDRLNAATAEFAARRMDRGVRNALAGKRIDALT